jgi:hypothetical protein
MRAFLSVGFILAAACLVDSPAHAQTLRERILVTPYSEIGTAIRIKQSLAGRTAPQSGGVIGIDSCNYTDEWGQTPDDDFVIHFAHIAGHYVHMRGLLTAAGYPEQVWDMILRRLVRAQLDEIVRRRNQRLDFRNINEVRQPALPYERRLASAMNEYRAQTGQALARPDVWKACGGDYVGFVKIKGSPEGANIRLIREFYFKLCQATGIAPFSDRCDKWSLITATRDVPGGVYYYQASWSNGPIECDRIEFTGAGGGEDDKVVTIARTGKACQR